MTRQGSPGEGVAGVGRGGRQPRICDTYLFSDAAETFILAEDMKEFSTIGSEGLLRSKVCVVGSSVDTSLLYAGMTLKTLQKALVARSIHC